MLVLFKIRHRPHVTLRSRAADGRVRDKSMKNLLTLTIVSLVIGPLAVLAQTGKQVSEKEFSTDLDAYIRRTMEAIPEIPSVAIVVVKDDKPIFIRAYGLANRENGTKADANTLYYIA